MADAGCLMLDTGFSILAFIRDSHLFCVMSAAIYSDCGAVEKPHSDGWSMGQSLIFVSQHGQTSLTVAPLVVNLDFFNSPTVPRFRLKTDDILIIRGMRCIMYLSKLAWRHEL